MKRKPKTTTTIKLVKSPLAKNCCKDRSGDGHICGDVFIVEKRIGSKRTGKLVSRKCQNHGHPMPSGK